MGTYNWLDLTTLGRHQKPVAGSGV